MTDVERRFCKLLLLADMAAILNSMVAGPLSHTSLAIGAAVSAIILSLAVIVYGIYFWPRQR